MPKDYKSANELRTVIFCVALTKKETCLGVSEVEIMRSESSRHCIVGVVGFASRPFFLASFPLKQQSKEPRDVLGYLSRICVRKITTSTGLPRLRGASNQLAFSLVHTQTNLKRRALRNSGLGVASMIDSNASPETRTLTGNRG